MGVAFCGLAFASLSSRVSAAEVIYDEAKVPPYKLPDPLVLQNGDRVASVKDWQQKRRPELLKLYQTEMYGRSPGRPSDMRFAVTSVEPKALEGKATRKEVTIYLTSQKDGPRINLLLYLPNQVKTPVPAMLGLNFDGNHTVHADPGITLPTQWVMEKGQVVNRRALESQRGASANRWQVEKILAQGFALVTAWYGDIEPDFVGGDKYGVRTVIRMSPDRADYAPDDWGAIGAWAWGLSRALDYLEREQAVDAKHVVVTGHSRLGKTALWAGAQDERFAVVISNDSGEGGAAITRRQFGETIAIINKAFPHWFCGNFKKYNDRENDLPMDQHCLVALMAPRPVYVASAEKDQWADPRGEFLAAKNAEPVYRLFGLKGLEQEDMPAIDHPVGQTIGYHIRTGVHDVTAYDWDQYLAFARRNFGMNPIVP